MKKLIIILSVIVIANVGLLYMNSSLFKKKEIPVKTTVNPYQSSKLVNNNQINNQPSKNETEAQIVKSIASGEDRPIAVMIDNEKGAWPHAGLGDAYMIYEIIIEGGESRMMALFRGETTKKIGPVRSSRHYFLDYALENGAIYAHFGWSPTAQNDIKTLGVNNINGLYDNYFWREGSSYHSAFTSMENILKFASKKGYKMLDSKELYSYSTEDYDLTNGKDLAKIKLNYSTLQNTSYSYNPQTKLYNRYMRGIVDKDRVTGKQYTAKNIVVMFVKNNNLNDEAGKGRQTLENIGSGKGYFITNGKYIDITWSKASRTAKTYLKDAQGNEVKFNNGQTWIQILPINAQVAFN